MWFCLDANDAMHPSHRWHIEPSTKFIKWSSSDFVCTHIGTILCRQPANHVLFNIFMQISRNLNGKRNSRGFFFDYRNRLCHNFGMSNTRLSNTWSGKWQERTPIECFDSWRLSHMMWPIKGHFSAHIKIHEIWIVLLPSASSMKREKICIWNCFSKQCNVAHDRICRRFLKFAFTEKLWTSTMRNCDWI